MPRIHRSNRLLDPLVKRNQSRPLPIRWFVERVVACYPRVVFVVLREAVNVPFLGYGSGKADLGEPFPEEDGAILEILVFPEQGLVYAYRNSISDLKVLCKR